MKSRAAVAFKAGAPLEIAEVDVQGPRSGEVMVEIKQRECAIPMRSRCQVMILKALFPRYWVMRVPALL